jgi:K(+)-stimulated pyrophosphate-energized sodium pump
VELSRRLRQAAFITAATVTSLLLAAPTYAQHSPGGEANLQLPDLSEVTFLNGINGHNLLLFGIVICILGLGFGLAIYMNLQRLPVHRAMREISELIYETCKTYLITQGKFILILEAFIAVVIVL